MALVLHTQETGALFNFAYVFLDWQLAPIRRAEPRPLGMNHDAVAAQHGTILRGSEAPANDFDVSLRIHLADPGAESRSLRDLLTSIDSLRSPVRIRNEPL